MSSTTAFAGSVPANYDKYLGPILFEPYALDLIDRLKKEKFKNVLELACGTGRVTNHLAKLIADDGILIATDLNADMITLAKTIVKNDKIKWQVADAQELSFEGDSYNAVICQFGVMFFQDKLKAFREVYKILAPGGKFLINVWDEMKYNPRTAIIKKVMDEIFKEEAPDFLEKGPYSFFDKEKIKMLLTEAGFKQIQIEVVQKTTVHADPDDFMKGFVDGSPLSSFLNDKPEAVQQQVRKKLKEEFAGQFQQYGSQIPMQALIVEAIK